MVKIGSLHNDDSLEIISVITNIIELYQLKKMIDKNKRRFTY